MIDRSLSWTGGLIFFGTLLIYWLEHNRLLANMRTDQALLVSLLSSDVSSRRVWVIAGEVSVSP